ncbi:TonB-dependent receptor [Dasania sp. GY-MA-18]|uniref:TonB-dependent receptor plug domain-containing protein n=1 Tax=Dasania TaxID=503005 RepID=UPI0021ACD852|nr:MULTISPECIES: TonB-dependent receptor [Dasania]MCR8922823.1 TonB-dependent receptor [Dasania sp. GY-MA-18]MCZ0868979.1 TonB-dependent receptor [Dasania phycosphaerae]
MPVVLSLIAYGLVGHVWAAESNGDVVVYEQAFFSKYNAVNAEDVLRRIPGVEKLLDAEQEEKRGIGSGGDQILINGKRIAGKANELSAALNRIPVERLSRVELIRSTDASLGVRSDGLLVNVITSETVAEGVGSWRLANYFYDDGHSNPAAELSYSNELGGMQYFIGAELESVYSADYIDENFFHSQSELNEQRRNKSAFDMEKYQLSANVIYGFDGGDELRVNALLASQKDYLRELSRRKVVNALGDQVEAYSELLESPDSSDQWELGLDYSHALSKQLSLKNIAIYSYLHEQTQQQQYRLDNSGKVINSSDSADVIDTEAIIRSSLLWQAYRLHSIELGVELAENILDTDFDLLLANNAGQLTPVDVGNAQSLVTEFRQEFFITHFWSPSSVWSIESGFNYERSRIEQEAGSYENRRDFNYVKPRFDVRYSLSSAEQLRLQLERSVSQLEFSDFVPSYDTELDRLDFGNPELQPEIAWELDLSYEYQLPNDNGTVEAKVFYNDIDEHISTVAVREGRSAVGNIGEAKLYGAKLSGSVRLAWLGLPEAIVSAEYTAKHSETTDPFSGQQRAINEKPDYDWRVGFRHDMISTALSYGAELIGTGPVELQDIDVLQRQSSLLNMNAFVEYQLAKGLVLRLEGNGLLENQSSRQRQRGLVAEQLITRTERADLYSTREWQLSLTGRF